MVVFETFIFLTRQISVVLREMKRNCLLSPHGEVPDCILSLPHAMGHHTDNCYIVNIDKEAFIQSGQLRKFVLSKEKGHEAPT